MSSRWIVMLGTEFNTKGGISAVVNTYRAGGLFARWPVRYLGTHCDGSALSKLLCAVTGFVRFTGLLLARRVAAVHVHAASRMSFWRKSPFLLLAFVSGRPVLFHLHGGGFREFYEHACGPLARAWVRAVFRRSAYVVVLSAYWEAWVKSVTPTASVRVIPNPAPDIAVCRDKSNTDLLMLFLGALVEKKGVFDLLEAMADLPGSHSRLRLILAGTGEAQEQIRQRIRQLGLDKRVDLPGWVDAQSRNDLFHRADMFVLPSYYEGLPMSLLEAMSAGLPAIASKVGGIPELIDTGVDGLLIASGDVPALRAAITTLADDAGLRERMGRAGRQKVLSRYGAAQVIAQVDALYAELMGEMVISPGAPVGGDAALS